MTQQLSRASTYSSMLPYSSMKKITCHPCPRAKAAQDLVECRGKGIEDGMEAPRTTKICKQLLPTKMHLQHHQHIRQLAAEEAIDLDNNLHLEATINIYRMPLPLSFAIMKLQGTMPGRSSMPSKKRVPSRKDSRLHQTPTASRLSDGSSASTSTRKASNQLASTSTTTKLHHTNGFRSTPKQLM